jgi:ElaB/YqjD/DUF883 family membrane-anchored ribosome-binding protein
MLTPDRPISMPPNSSYGAEAEAHETTLAELRNDLAEVTADVRRVIDARTKRAQQAASAGIDMARDTIKANPVASMMVATAVGAAVALLIVPAPHAAPRLRNIREWAPHVTRADLQEMMGQLQATASNATAGTPLLSIFERVVDSVSSIDPKTTLTPALEKAGAWLSSFRTSVLGK